MELTLEERKILDGEEGEARQFAMEILVQIGKSCGAKRLIPIDSVHLVLHAYKSAFTAGVEAAERIAEMGGKFTVPTTIDPCGMDTEDWRAARTPEDYAKMQIRLNNAVMKMGVIPVWTCTPYYGFNLPRFKENIAWSESSAVSFANTVCGARTNRQSAIIDICMGIIGKAPEMGLYLDENRKGEVLINLKIERPLKQWEYPALGFALGKKLGSRIGVIDGMQGSPTQDNLKSLCAAAAASGSVALMHIVGITPEARTIEDAFKGNTPKETVEIKEEDLITTRREMNTHNGDKIDFIALGCPHYSINEMLKVRDILNGRKIDSSVTMWIFANSYAIKLSEEMGVRKELEEAGITIRAETCMIISPLSEWGFKTIMTDSGKCTHYAPMECKTDIVFASTKECVESAVAGRIIMEE